MVSTMSQSPSRLLSKAAVLSLGTELTRGELLNSNARWLAERLVVLGFTVV
jgi:molybdopterin-biosynthesis enzyme MoeA-like protein